MAMKRYCPHLCLFGLAIVTGLALAGAPEDPTPDMIRKAMMPTGENVADNPPVLRIRTEKERIAVGESLVFHAELHNTGSRYLVIYMPGLTGFEEFHGDRKDLRPDEYGPPQSWGRFAHRDERQDFVVLMPGDYYGRSYTWQAPDRGKVVFSFDYENRKAGEQLGVQTWTGKIPGTQSGPVLVVAAK